MSFAQPKTASRTGKVFALSLGEGLTTVVALVSGMVLARVLSQTDLATYRQTMLAYDVALPLLSLGISTGLYYFLPTEKTRARGVVVDGLLLMVAMGLLYAVFIALGGNHFLAKRFSNPAIVNTLVYLVPLPIIMLPAKLLSSVMVVQGQVQKLTIYNVLASLLLATSLIAACLAWRNPDAMVLTRVGVSIVSGVVAIGLMLRAVPADSWRPSFACMGRMVAYSLPLVGASALATVSLQLDKLIVSSMCTPEQFAVYSNGALEIPLIAMLTGSISNVLVVDFRKAYAAGNFAEALRLYHLVPAKTSLILFPVMVYLALAAKPFICVLFSEKYAASATAFTVYLLMIPYRTILLGGLAAAGKSKIVFRNSAVGLVINLVLSVVLVHFMGYIGAVIGTVVALGLWGFPMALYEIGRSIHASLLTVYPWRAVGKNLLLALMAAIPAAIVLGLSRHHIHIVRLAVSSLAYALAYAALLLASGNADAKQMLATLGARVRR